MIINYDMMKWKEDHHGFSSWNGGLMSRRCERWNWMGRDSCRDFQLIFVTGFRALMIRHWHNVGRRHRRLISLVRATYTKTRQRLRTTAKGYQRRRGATEIVFYLKIKIFKKNSSLHLRERKQKQKRRKKKQFVQLTGKCFSAGWQFHAFIGDGQVLLFGTFLSSLTWSLTLAGVGSGFLHFSLFLIRRFADFDAIEAASTTADGYVANGRTATPVITSTRTGKWAVAWTRFRTSYCSIELFIVISLDGENINRKKKNYLTRRFRR